jgi:hypothetical protein
MHVQRLGDLRGRDWPVAVVDDETAAPQCGEDELAIGLAELAADVLAAMDAAQQPGLGEGERPVGGRGLLSVDQRNQPDLVVVPGDGHAGDGQVRVQPDVGLVGTACGMSYSSDLTDAQWAMLEPVVNAPGKSCTRPQARRTVTPSAAVSLATVV